MIMEEKKAFDLGVGVTVMLLLGAMTVGEFFIGLYAFHWWTPLLVVATIKAFLILRDYMHIGRLFASADEGEHS
jgi:hypothetical protein